MNFIIKIRFLRVSLLQIAEKITKILIYDFQQNSVDKDVCKKSRN